MYLIISSLSFVFLQLKLSEAISREQPLPGFLGQLSEIFCELLIKLIFVYYVVCIIITTKIVVMVFWPHFKDRSPLTFAMSVFKL